MPETAANFGESSQPSTKTGRGGRGRGQGRPHGQSDALKKPRNSRKQARSDHDLPAECAAGPAPALASKPPPKPRLTHFVSLPIGHHAELRESMSNLASALLSSKPCIPGLDRSIIIPPRRLHLTLGVMSLTDPADLQAARSLLAELRPRILDALGKGGLRVGLQRVDIMKPDRGDSSRAHVMFAGPDPESEDGRKLWNICNMVQKEFKDAGFIVDYRPLKLHCTVINTIYRKPRPRGARTPFSYSELVASQAFRKRLLPTDSQTVVVADIAVEDDTPEGKRMPKQRKKLEPVHVDLGSWPVDEIQICEMGSWGPEGEYVRVDGCSLVQDD